MLDSMGSFGRCRVVGGVYWLLVQITSIFFVKTLIVWLLVRQLHLVSMCMTAQAGTMKYFLSRHLWNLIKVSAWGVVRLKWYYDEKSSIQFWFYLKVFSKRNRTGFINTSYRSRDVEVFEICKWEAYDVIYSQRLNKIHKMRNISGNNIYKVLKLCTCTPIRIVHTSLYSMLLPRRPLRNWSLLTKKLKS